MLQHMPEAQAISRAMFSILGLGLSIFRQIKVRDNDNNHATAVPATATTTTPKLLWLPMVLMLLLWQVRWSRKRCGERQDGLGIQGAAINPRAPATQIVDYWGT